MRIMKVQLLPRKNWAVLILLSFIVTFSMTTVGQPPASAGAPFYIYAPWDSGKSFAVGNPSGQGGGYYGHNSYDYYAVDINGPGNDCGENVRSTSSGTVVSAAFDSGGGNMVVINHGGGYTSMYQHLQDMLVSAGGSVSQGQIIGHIGSTGSTSGGSCHLHFVVRSGAGSTPTTWSGTSTAPSPMSGVALSAPGNMVTSNNVPSGTPGTGNNNWGFNVNGNTDANDDLLWYAGTTLNIFQGSGHTLGGWSTNTLSAPVWASVGDIDGDHRDDLWWYDNSNTLHIFGSNGTNFGATWEQTYTLSPATWAAVADVNGDGADDLLWYSGTTLNIIRSTGGVLNGQDTNTLSAPVWASVGDLDKDHKDDLWWYDNANTLHIFGSSGTNFSGTWEKTFTLSAPTWAAVADVNGDTADDLLWYSGTTLTTIRASGCPTNCTLNGQDTNSLSAPRWAGVGDLDGDGKDDLWWNDFSNHLYVFASDGTHFAGWSSTFSLSPASWASFGSFPNTNGDGMQ